MKTKLNFTFLWLGSALHFTIPNSPTHWEIKIESTVDGHEKVSEFTYPKVKNAIFRIFTGEKLVTCTLPYIIITKN